MCFCRSPLQFPEENPARKNRAAKFYTCLKKSKAKANFQVLPTAAYVTGEEISGQRAGEARCPGSVQAEMCELCFLPWRILGSGQGALCPACSLRAEGAEPTRFLKSPCFVPRSQELHLRTEAHSYLSDLTKPSDLEFIETKRPRLDLLQDPLLRHSPLLSQGQQAGSEELPKVRAVPGSLWLVQSCLCDAVPPLRHTVRGAVGWHAEMGQLLQRRKRV